MKKQMALLLSALLMMQLTLPALAAEKDEMQPREDVVGLVTALGEDFLPQEMVSRAQVFQAVYALEGMPSVQEKTTLTDAAGTAYADLAAWAQQTGLTQGNGGKFYGERGVLRQELAAVLYRYAQSKKAVDGKAAEVRFADGEAIAPWAREAAAWCVSQKILRAQEEGFSPRAQVSGAELTQALGAMVDALGLGRREVKLADYLAQGGEEWFSTGKRAYTIQGMMVSKETSFHNPLEVTDYVVQDDGVSVILKGTVGEQWVTKLEKVMKTYTLADGSPVTAETFAQKDCFVSLSTKASPNRNFAMFVPAGISVEVETAWGDVLHTNQMNAPHGQGDYLVCNAGEDGKPDLSDVWVVNGMVFPSTYQMPQD